MVKIQNFASHDKFVIEATFTVLKNEWSHRILSIIKNSNKTETKSVFFFLSTKLSSIRHAWDVSFFESLNILWQLNDWLEISFSKTKTLLLPLICCDHFSEIRDQIHAHFSHISSSGIEIRLWRVSSALSLDLAGTIPIISETYTFSASRIHLPLCKRLVSLMIQLITCFSLSKFTVEVINNVCKLSTSCSSNLDKCHRECFFKKGFFGRQIISQQHKKFVSIVFANPLNHLK